MTRPSTGWSGRRSDDDDDAALALLRELAAVEEVRIITESQTGRPWERCLFCGAGSTPERCDHEPDCLWARARALVRHADATSGAVERDVQALHTQLGNRAQEMALELGQARARLAALHRQLAAAMVVVEAARAQHAVMRGDTMWGEAHAALVEALDAYDAAMEADHA